MLSTDNPQVLGSCWSGKGNLRPEYPVVIDTGFDGCVMVTDSIVEDAGLGFYPKRSDNGTAGLCHLCQLKIGDIVFVHPPCFSMAGHYEKKLIGKDSLVAHKILLGLGLLKQFKYILIDIPADQIEFSVQDSFSPDEPDLWRIFPMTIETRQINNYVLFVTVPIEGKDRNVKFDTGASLGMIVTTSYWQEFSKLLDYEGPKDVLLKKPFGYKKADYYTVKQLQFAGDIISNAEIITLPVIDSEFDNSKILLGMKFFRGCTLVLDFENGLLRVKDKL